MFTEEMYDELKRAIFMSGRDAIDDLLGYECPYDDKDVIENWMDEVLDQMPEEEAMKFYQKYCGTAKETEAAYPYIRMACDFTVRTMKKMPFKTDGMEFQGLCAETHGKLIQFDFAASRCHVEEISDTEYQIHYESGHGALLDEFMLDDCYDEEYRLIRLDRKDITAKYLSEMTLLREFLVEPDVAVPYEQEEILAVHIDAMSFSDEAETYEVSKEALRKY